MAILGVFPGALQAEADHHKGLVGDVDVAVAVGAGGEAKGPELCLKVGRKLQLGRSAGAGGICLVGGGSSRHS